MTKSASKPKSVFTMILLVVVGMLVLLAAALTLSISGARRWRARIQVATVTAQEMTNAILAYEYFAPDMELKEMDDQVATTSSLAFILGEGKNDRSGQLVPVLFNGQPSDDGRFLDPWGHPYYVTIKMGSAQSHQSYTVGVLSWGPDGVRDTDDDISTWPLEVK